MRAIIALFIALSPAVASAADRVSLGTSKISVRPPDGWKAKAEGAKVVFSGPDGASFVAHHVAKDKAEVEIEKLLNDHNRDLEELGTDGELREVPVKGMKAMIFFMKAQKKGQPVEANNLVVETASGDGLVFLGLAPTGKGLDEATLALAISLAVEK